MFLFFYYYYMMEWRNFLQCNGLTLLGTNTVNSSPVKPASRGLFSSIMGFGWAGNYSAEESVENNSQNNGQTATIDAGEMTLRFSVEQQEQQHESATIQKTIFGKQRRVVVL
jgi:hypothetical protein